VIQREFITENPVRVKVRGEYHQLGIFLSKVANLERIVNVSNLMVKPGDDKNGGGKDRAVRNYTIEAELTLTAYTLAEGGETSNEKANNKPQQKAHASKNS
jgi:Tfp pilus assembly protein PilO